MSIFANEADLVREFVAQLPDYRGESPWTVYPETAGWDLLLQHKDGFQLGLEAKLSLNAKVIEQSLSNSHSYYHTNGPDYRGVLVPDGKAQLHLQTICRHIGIGIITIRRGQRGVYRSLNLPSQDWSYGDWPNWCPSHQVNLPDYVPDVEGGKPSPIQLTPWKIAAIKLMIVMEQRGYVTRDDFKALRLSPSRWTDLHVGLLDRAERGRFVAGKHTPDFRQQHPVNFEQIKADAAKWMKDAGITVEASGVDLFGDAA